MEIERSAQSYRQFYGLGDSEDDTSASRRDGHAVWSMEATVKTLAQRAKIAADAKANNSDKLLK